MDRTKGHTVIRKEVLKCQTHRKKSACLALIDWISPGGFDHTKAEAVKELRQAGCQKSAQIVEAVSKEEYYEPEFLD